MKSPLRAAAYQMETTEDVSTNADKICGAIEEAAGSGAELLVVPECALSGYLPSARLDFELLNREQERVARLVSRHRMWLALGTTEKRDSAWYNTALLVSPEGAVVARCDKAHLTPGDRPVFSAGQELPVFHVGEWTLALQICFDMRFPESWRLLRRKGAELILHLSNASREAAWKVPVLEGTIRCRAAENGMFVVSANGCRKPQMLVSAVCDPDGKHLAHAGENTEMIIYAELDRAETKDDFLNARRTDLWGRPENSSLLLT